MILRPLRLDNFVEISTLESQVVSLSLGGHVRWQFRIDLTTPESPTCSSPTSEAIAFNYPPDSADLIDSVEVDVPLSFPALIKQIMSKMPFTGERPLLEHLLWKPVTLADVEFPVPAFIKSAVVMDQLVVNIGYFSALGLIPSHDLERMLLYLLTVGDDQSYLYKTTKARIEFERQRRQHLEYIDSQKRVEPCGQLDRVINRVQHFATGVDFSRSRLHNGPGLTDRKHPKVRLPQNGTRLASAMPSLLASEMNTEPEQYSLWGQSKAIFDSLSDRKQKGEIVANLPPKEPAAMAQITTHTFAIRNADGSSL